MNPRIHRLLLFAAWMSAALSLAAQDSLQLRLMHAIETQNLPLVKEYVKKGADANMSVVATSPDYLFFISRKLYLEGISKSRPGEIVYVSPIHANALHADLKIFQYLRKRKANLDAGDSDGKTPLMYALRNPGGEEFALYLLKKGANYQAKDVAGNTAMHYAAYGGNIEGLRLTAGGGIDINVRNAEGITPLHAAAVFSGVSVLAEIVGLGGDIHALDSAGMSALHYAAAFADDDCLEWILEQAPELNVEAANGYTPLDIARAARNLKAVALLKRKGGRYAAYRYQEMLDAIHAHQQDRLRLILEDGADPNRKTDEYPLVIAVSEGDHVSTELLIGAGARIDVLSKDKKALLDIALADGKPNIGLSLVRAGAAVSSKQLGLAMDQLAAKVGLPAAWTDLVKAMAPKVGNLDAPLGALNIPALHYAAYLGLEDLVEAFIQAGAGVNAGDEEGWTPLHWTVMKRDLLRLHLEKLRIAERLLTEGASVNPKASNPKTLPHKEPYLAKRVPANATPFDLLNYAPPKDADLAELFQVKGGVSGLGAPEYFENGVQLFQSREFHSAQLEFGKVILAQPGNAEGYYYRARCISIQRLYVEVERDLNRAIELRPVYPEAYLARAIARIELEAYKEALGDATKALSQGVAKGEGHYWMGKVKLRLEDREGACEEFRTSSEAGYADGTQAIKLYCK